MDFSDAPQAELVEWASPFGVPMTLKPIAELGGRLHVRVADGAVTLQGVHCRQLIGDRNKPDRRVIQERTLREVRLTLPLASCQITWQLVPQPE